MKEVLELKYIFQGQKTLKFYFFGLADRSELIIDSETEGRRVLAGSRVSRWNVVFFSGRLVSGDSR